MRFFATILALLQLGACGTKTSLTLPPRAAAEGAAQAQAAKPAPADDSKAGARAR